MKLPLPKKNGPEGDLDRYVRNPAGARDREAERAVERVVEKRERLGWYDLEDLP